MASTNKTANLELPQWEAADSFEMADMNSAFGLIDAAVKEVKDGGLKLYTILESDIGPTSLKAVTFELGGEDLSSYAFFVISLPETTTCSPRLMTATENMGLNLDSQNSGSCTVCFPMGRPESTVAAQIFRNYSSTGVQSPIIKYRDIISVCCTVATGNFSNGIKIRIMGVK